MIRPRELSPTIALFPARTPTLPPATHTNSYALGGRQVLLVEPASPYVDEQGEWIAWARGLASQGREIVGIFVTHHHEDHVGGIGAFARALGVPTLAHAETAARVDVPVDRLLADGDAIDLDGPRPTRLAVLHTPGHAAGHLCLREEGSGALVVGDMVASVGTILVAPGEGDMGAYLAQLERLSRLDATLALPAHGEPIDAPNEVFARYIGHRLAREAKVVAAVRQRPGAPPEALVELAYDDAPVHVWPIARLSLLAHAEKLVRDGVITERGEGFAPTEAA